jgi:hypothetical protein
MNRSAPLTAASAVLAVIAGVSMLAQGVFWFWVLAHLSPWEFDWPFGIAPLAWFGMSIATAVVAGGLAQLVES